MSEPINLLWPSNKLPNALWHFYCCQSTADVTNVFQSGAIMTIKVSSGAQDEPLTTWLRPVSATSAPGASSLLDEVIVLSRRVNKLTHLGGAKRLTRRMSNSLRLTCEWKKTVMSFLAMLHNKAALVLLRIHHVRNRSGRIFAASARRWAEFAGSD